MRYHAADAARKRALGEAPVEVQSAAPASKAPLLGSEDMDKNLPACIGANTTCAVNDWQGLVGSELTAAQNLCSDATGQFIESNCPRLALGAASVKLMPFADMLPTPAQDVETASALSEAYFAAAEQQRPIDPEVQS